MQARFFDAGTFLPSNATRAYSYHWTERKPSRYLLISKEVCHKMNVAGCVHKPFSRSGVSWVEIYNSLGGDIEFFDNKVRREFNLKVSSKHHSGESEYHSLGLRYDFDELVKSEKIKKEQVGFRCLKYTY